MEVDPRSLQNALIVGFEVELSEVSTLSNI
jgi:hypothetical protein